MKKLVYWNIDDWLALCVKLLLAGFSLVIVLLTVLAAVNIVKLIVGGL